MRTTRPPRLAAWLLRRLLPSDARGASILGDLIEEFQLERSTRSRAAAIGAYWRRALSIAVHALFARLSSVSTIREMPDAPVRRRTSMGFGLLREDARYAVRGLAKSPAFTGIALTTLALGIGASTAILSIAYTVLLQPLPYAEPDRLMHISETERSGGTLDVAWPNYLDWRARAASFEELACSRVSARNLTQRARPSRLEAREVTGNFFRVLRTVPAAGRFFDEADDRVDAPATVVISHALWMQELGGQASAIGQSLILDGRPHTIVGVLPSDFSFLVPTDIFTPIGLRLTPRSALLDRVNHPGLYALGRLKPGVEVRQADAELQAIAAALAREYPKTNTGFGARVVPLADRVVREFRQTLIVLVGAVCLLLLIACVNLTNLLLTRGSTRAHELAVRAALGASRWRLLRQMIVEHTVLVAAGAVLGAIVGAALVKLLVALAPVDVPRINEVRLEDATLLSIAALSSLCALLFGVMPALKASGVRGQELLVRAGRAPRLSTARLRRSLIIAEVAIAAVLLAGSGLMVRTMMRLMSFDSGFESKNVLTMYFVLAGDAWHGAPRLPFYEQFLARVRSMPGVENAGLIYSLPIDGAGWYSTFILDDRPEPPPGNRPGTAISPTSDGYFETMKIRLLRGRSIDRTDREHAVQTVVINETLARRMWPDGDPIGRRFKQGSSASLGPWRTIVGVVADVKMEGLENSTPMQAYIPLPQEPANRMALVVRAPNAAQLAPSIERVLHDFDKNVPTYHVRTMEDVIAASVARQRVSMVLLTLFGAVAMLLAMIGVYGAIAHAVTERTQEIGVRMALGATRANVLRLFLSQGLIAAAYGIVIGVAMALTLTRWLETLLFGVTATDAPTFASVAAVLVIVAAAACYVPARRAARVDPLVALRWE